MIYAGIFSRWDRHTDGDLRICPNNFGFGWTRPLSTRFEKFLAVPPEISKNCIEVHPDWVTYTEDLVDQVWYSYNRILVVEWPQLYHRCISWLSMSCSTTEWGYYIVMIQFVTLLIKNHPKTLNAEPWRLWITVVNNRPVFKAWDNTFITVIWTPIPLSGSTLQTLKWKTFLPCIMT